MISGIYCIENLINSKKYIGKSYDIEKRWLNHKTKLSNKIHENNHLQKSWNKYGQENFNFYIIEECPKEKLIEKEIFYISYFDTKVNGYNMTDGGDGAYGYTHSIEAKQKISTSNKKRIISEKTKKKMSESLKRRKVWNKGVSVSKEAKEKMSKAKIGKKYSEDTKRKMSISRIREKNHFFGKHHSEETKKKISEKKINPSKETIKKLSESHKGKTLPKSTKIKMSNSKKGENNPNFGKTMSEESKKKVSESLRRSWITRRLLNGK